MKEAPSSHLQESSNTIHAELIEASSSKGQSQGVEVAKTTSNNQQGDDGSSGNHHAPCRVQSFLGDCALEDLEYEQNEAPNAAPSKVDLEAQSSLVRRRLSCQVRVAIDDTIERLLQFEEDDNRRVSASEGKGEVDIDNGSIKANTASVHREPSSQVSIAIDDTIKKILFMEDDDKEEASATEAKEEGFVESGKIAAKWRPSSQVMMTIDDTIEQLLIEIDETEASDAITKGEGNVDSGNITTKTAPAQRRPSSQVSMDTDDTIEQLLIEIDETEASDAKVKKEGNVDNGNFTAKTAPAQRRPSSQVSMAIDDAIKRILFSEDEEEDVVPSGTEATESRDVPREEIVAKIVPVFITDDIIRTHDKSHTCKMEFTLNATPVLRPTEENKTSEGGNLDNDASLKAPNVSSAQLNSSPLTKDAHVAAEMFIQEVSMALQIPEKSEKEDGTNVVADEDGKALFVPSAPFDSSTSISDAHIAAEEFIKDVTLALEMPEQSKLEDGTNVVADENSKALFVPFAPLATSTLISDAHNATEVFIQEATFALERPEKRRIEYGTNVVADGNSENPSVPSAPLARSPCNLDAQTDTEELIQEATLALEIPERSKIEDGTNVVADENSEAPSVPSAPLARSSFNLDAHTATEELTQEATLALEIPERSKIEDGTNVVADENSEAPSVPSAPLARSSCNLDAHTATEELTREATLALEIPERSKIEDGTNVVADENSEAPSVPSAPLARSSCNLDAHTATERFIQEATLALEILEKCQLEESNNVAADEKSESPRVPSALFDSSTVASTAHTPSTLKRGAFEADECVVHDEKTETSCCSSARTIN